MVLKILYAEGHVCAQACLLPDLSLFLDDCMQSEHKPGLQVRMS